MNELNVMHISRTMGQGGAERIVYQLADSLRDRCGMICVASAGGCHVEELEAEGIRHFQIDDLEQKNPLVILRTFLSLSRIVRRYKINIIHSHHRMAAVYAQALKLLFPKLKLVYTAHNVFRDKKHLTRAALRNTAVVAVGYGVRDNLTDFYDIAQTSVKVIHNAIHPEPSSEKYQNQTLSEWKARGTELVGVIGRLSEQKGIDVFLRVIADLKSRGRQVRGIIIGDGEERNRLVCMSHELGIDEKILFLGYQEHVSTLISQLDLVVMPSRWEGFPLLVLEVFAEKKTIVGSNISGINEIITDGENGRLVTKDEPDLFADAVCELLEHPEIRDKMGKNGFEYYRKSFSYEIFAEQYFQLYQKVLEIRQR